MRRSHVNAASCTPTSSCPLVPVTIRRPAVRASSIECASGLTRWSAKSQRPSVLECPRSELRTAKQSPSRVDPSPEPGQGEFLTPAGLGQSFVGHAVVEVDHTVAKSPLIEQSKSGADLARKSLLPTSHHNRIEKQMTLVDQVGPKRECCELGATNGQVTWR